MARRVKNIPAQHPRTNPANNREFIDHGDKQPVSTAVRNKFRIKETRG